MEKLTVKILTTLLASTALLGCSQSAELELPAHSGLTISVIDKEVAVADGFTDLNVRLQVRDMLGNNLKKYQLNITTPIQSGVNYRTCQPTDDSGVAICIMRAHLDGSKNVDVIGTDQNFNVIFVPQKDNRGLLFEMTADSAVHVPAGTDWVTASVGRHLNTPIVSAGTGLLRSDISIQY